MSHMQRVLTILVALVILVVPICLTACSEGDTIIWGGGELRPENFPGTTVDEKALEEDARAFSEESPPEPPFTPDPTNTITITILPSDTNDVPTFIIIPEPTPNITHPPPDNTVTVEVITPPNPLEAAISVTTKDKINDLNCDCDGVATITASARDPNGKCKITLAEVYIDGQLVNRTRLSVDSSDESTKARADWNETYNRAVRAGRHTATLKVTNEYGQEITREIEFFCCKKQLTMTKASIVPEKLFLNADASVVMSGEYPDCKAVLNITWSANAREKGFYLYAAWLRVDGKVVDGYKSPISVIANTDWGAFLNELYFPGMPEGSSYTHLGGKYSCPVAPGSTVLIEVIALGPDCKYYVSAWQKEIPRCSQAAGGGGGAPCFHPDTLVLMADDSTKRIADIQTGDLVKSYDVNSGEMVVCEVTAIDSGQADYYYLVNGNLRVTPPHPFLTADGSWVPVEDLKIGDRIISISGCTDIISVKLVEESQTICNISVAGTGTFFVSADGKEFFLVKEE